MTGETFQSFGRGPHQALTDELDGQLVEVLFALLGKPMSQNDN